MKLKFPKIRMIWAIIRGRSVVYKIEVTKGFGFRVKTDKACIVGCTFVGGIVIKDHKGVKIAG